MAKVEMPVTVKVVVYGDPFAEQSPRVRELAARSAIERAQDGGGWFAENTAAAKKAIAEDPELAKAVDALSCTDWQDEPTRPGVEKERVIALYFPQPGAPVSTSGDVIGPMHIVVAGGHCGDVECNRCDPMERMVDGLTVRECLEKYQAWQRADYGAGSHRDGWYRIRMPMQTAALTDLQKAAAQSAWSAQLRAKQEQVREKERVEIVCDDDRWEP